MTKRTKIIATLGPASSDQDTIKQLISAGANVFRLNFSHGSADDQKLRCANIRQAAQELNTQVAILGDLQGPKIRIAKFANGGIDLKKGDIFTLNAAINDSSGDQSQVGVTYPELAKDCAPGQTLLLDDGRLELLIEDIKGKEIRTRVAVGGTLYSNKGINLRGGGLSAPALTDKDYADIKTAAELEVDYLAISFPRTGDDIRFARQAAQSANCHARLVAKVERAEAVASEETLVDIIEASDAVMVARGDLGVEIGDAELIGVQKKMIHLARKHNRVVITATQMMETMIENSLPTRAEVFDVANAVLDGTDAVMLSAETATGKHPVKVVEAMSRIIIGAEKDHILTAPKAEGTFAATDEAIAMSAMYAANHLSSVKAILCLTESGNTPLWMSRIRSGIRIYGISRNGAALRAMCLYRGVIPMAVDSSITDASETLNDAMSRLKKSGALQEGDQVLATFGSVFGLRGQTNTLKIISVP